MSWLIRNVLNSVTLVLIGALLSGCWGMAKNIRVEKNYSFPDKENDGIVLMSVKNPSNNGDYLNLYLSHDDKDINQNMSYGLQHIKPLTLSKRANGSFALPNTWNLDKEQGTDEIIALKIPVGNYRIWSWQLGDFSPVGYSKEYRFTVEKDKVMYIGQFVFHMELNSLVDTYRIDIVNKAEEDKKFFLKKHPRFSQNDIKTSLAVQY